MKNKILKTNPQGYWTKERCQLEALKYKTRGEFKSKSATAYGTLHNNGWFDECCSHMKFINRPNGYWTKERCHIEALKHNTRTEFKEKSSGAYYSAHKKGLLDEICSHMEYKTSLKERFIYSYEFSDNYVYVGLTYNVNVRNCSHMSSTTSPVYIHFNKTKSSFILKTLAGPISMKNIGNLEREIIEKYKKEKWNLLNNYKGGGLGGSITLWTKEACKNEALKHNKRGEFKKMSIGAYTASRRHKWLDEVCSHMEYTPKKTSINWKKQTSNWIKEQCKNEALKYQKRSELKKKSQTIYTILRKNNWLDEACSHMKVCWTKERCHSEALKYNTRNEFRKKSAGAYCSAQKKGLLDEICSHMKLIILPKGYWTKDRCHSEALKCDTKNEFKKKSPGAYSASYKNGFIDEICSHMKKK